MREIIFRGKKKNGADAGKWIYGSLIQSKDGICSIWNEDVIDDVEVEPETVGQFTGLCDCTGYKIFEHDICTSEQEPFSKYVVEWSDKASCFCIVGDKTVYYLNQLFGIKLISHGYIGDNDAKFLDWGR